MLAIVDYGVGNIFSLSRSFAHIGVETIVTNQVADLKKADQILLPGVGAFGDAMEKLKQLGLDQVLIELAENKKPILGVCLGMQLLFKTSEEFGTHQGLGLLEGRVVSLKEALASDYPELKVPHIGWNPLTIQKEASILPEKVNEQEVYYVHSFYVTDCEESLVATSEYGRAIPGFVQKGNIYGAQFHPEKSGEVGLAILKAFSEVKA